MREASIAEIERQIKDSIAVKEAILQSPVLLEQVEHLALACLASLRSGGKIVFAGNGGSFADAQHLSAEFTSRFQFDRAPLASLALATNGSAISAIGNDYGFDNIFARELAAVAKPGDVYVPITTSGNSANIIESIKVAKRIDMPTFCFTGQTGGRARDLCECICVPSQVTARIQECHILLGHILCGIVENTIFQAPAGTGGRRDA